jgi:hypothetical protein
MAQPPSYHELLAEVYEENAKSNLIYQQEFQNERVEAFEDEDLSENELEDRDEFNKFHGNRGKPEHVIKPKAKPDNTGKSSYAFDRNIRTYAINIDGRFRGSILIEKPGTCTTSPIIFAGTNSANFLFTPSRQYKNIHSLRVTSFEFFNSFYTYSAVNTTTGLGRGNTTFKFLDFGPIAGNPFPPTPLNTYDITIQDGNWVIVDPIVNPEANNYNLLYLIQEYIRVIVPGYSTSFNVGLNAVSNLVYFQDINNYFAIQFPATTDNPNGNGIGYNLGFYGTYYASAYGTPLPPYFNPGFNEITADTIYDSVEDTYIYLRINDYPLIKHQNADQTEFTAFMKIPLTSPKNAIQFMNSTTNTAAREYFFQQPTNITSLLFELVDAYGKTLQMNGSTFSVTLEFQEILQSDIYEKMLEL